MRLYLFYIPNVDSFPICLGAEANNSLQQLVALRAATVAIFEQYYNQTKAFWETGLATHEILRLHKVLHKESSSPEAKSSTVYIVHKTWNFPNLERIVL